VPVLPLRPLMPDSSSRVRDAGTGTVIDVEVCIGGIGNAADS